jgi:hypothetical protein
MMSNFTHAAAFVLPVAVAAFGFSAFAMRQKSVALKAIATDRVWTGSALRTYGTSFDPQSRGSSG